MPPERKKPDHGRDGEHQAHHARMTADFRRRFWVSAVLSFPILALAPLIQGLPGVEEAMGLSPCYDH